MWRQAPRVCPWQSPLVVNLQSKIKGITLKKMNERSPKETIIVVKNKKGRIPTTKLREQQPCQPPKYPSTSPRKERIPLTSFHPRLRDPKQNQPLLPQGRQAKGDDIQTKETCHKDGKDSTFQDQATLFPKSEAKGRGENCHSKALPVNPRLPNQESSLE